MAKLSGREKWAQQTGRPKEEYPGSKKSSSSKTKTPDYSSFMVDTKPIEKAYSTATESYLTELSALKPRYEQLYQQLEAQKVLQAEKDTALSAEEGTLQKQNIAKRGIAVDDTNQFFTGERSKLQVQQNVRDRETALGFAGKRLEIGGAESADTREINTAIANIGLSKANKIADIVDRNKTTLYNLEKDKKAKEQWEKTFAYTKSKDEADRALEKYKANQTASTATTGGSVLADIQDVLLKSRGKDGKIDPGKYLEERSNYLRKVKGASVTDYDKQFGGLLSPQEQIRLGITQGEIDDKTGKVIKYDKDGRAYVDA